MAYPEDEGGADVGASYNYAPSRLGRNLEGVIPLILIVVIAAVAGGYLGLWDIPFVFQHSATKMLIIGQPSLETMATFDQSKDLVKYVTKSSESLKLNPKEYIAQYDIVWLDQSNIQPEGAKYIPRQLGEALTEYVKKGGKLVTVMDSGIFRKGDISIVGWEGTFQSDVVPAKCEADYVGNPSCINAIFVPQAEIWSADPDHPIMKGITVVPAIPTMPKLSLTTFNVTPNGYEIAYIQSTATPESYPGLIEKRLLLGKSIYINYNPGIIPPILQNILVYLR